MSWVNEKSAYDIANGFKCQFCDKQFAGTKFNCIKSMLAHVIEYHVNEVVE